MNQKSADQNRETWVVIASGPSLTQAQVDYCQGRARVLAINDNFRLAPWADCLYACDLKWWDWNHDDALEFESEKWTQDKKAADKYGLFYIESSSKLGLSVDKSVIHQGCNGGYQAINLAYHFGAERIVLIGYDMKIGKDGRSHWFGDHKDSVRSNYGSWLPLYGSIASHAKEIGLDIVNCTMDSALTCFRKADLREIL